MTARASKPIDGQIDDLDLSHAGNELERLNNHSAMETAGHKADDAVPMVSSVEKSLYSHLDPAIAKQAVEAANRIRSHIGSKNRSMIEIGKELLLIKAQLDHGQFGTWLDAEFTMTTRSAQKYMNVARMVEQTSVHAVLDLPDTALQILAAPSADLVREEIIADIKAGKVPSPKSLKEMIATAMGAVNAPARVASAKTTPTSLTPAKASSAAIATPPADRKIPPSARAAPAVAEALLATSKTLSRTGAPPSPSAISAPATSEQAKAAASLIGLIKDKLELSEFAELYAVAGHEMFRNAMAEALDQANRQIRLH
ncbi:MULTISPECIES: DUF3102 domain-containing protein [Mesorhizobium]|uniref:DUF3102 domain-containing protein n=1 Tax=Mesorhizobium TaxID=68287 RepID=UPI0003CF69B2|nr:MULTISPECIES: DUF3102 domain-containing protein [Mesorhizobium]ESY66310.1 hypothetical protein X742_19700 [Mesorhizobium sp. LNHC232B00]WJI38620.1 DUF3102 domain-containing protein [Mesorhizobium opportunistum]